METVAVITTEDRRCRGRVVKKERHGRELVYIKLKKGGGRLLRKTIDAHKITKAVAEGELYGYAEDILRGCGVKLCSGRELAVRLLPELVRRASKYDGGKEYCTVYESDTDDETIKIVKEAAKRFRYVSLCSKNGEAERIAEYIMEETGLSLKLGEYREGVAVVCAGKGGEQEIKIDLETFDGISVKDEKGRSISLPLAEALYTDEEDLKNLKVKLCRARNK